MDLPTIAKALYTDYEVEQPQFQTGDKVILCGRVVTLKTNREFMGADAWSVQENDGVRLYTADLVRATPEEIYWLETLEREKVEDFKEGDIFVDESGGLYTIGIEIDSDVAAEWASIGVLKAIYLVESFKPFPEEEAE